MGSLNEQLSFLKPPRYTEVPRVRVLMQMLAKPATQGPESRALARKTVLQWARSRWPGLIPAAAFDGDPFNNDAQPGLRIAVTSNDDRSLWMFRSEHLDRETARSWMTEALVADADQVDVVGCRNSCSSMSEEVPALTVPSFVSEWSTRLSLIDGNQSIINGARSITSPEDFGSLLALLFSPQRSMPVIALSETPAGSNAIDPQTLARSLIGLAHVVWINSEQTFALTDGIGKSLSVFGGAIRTYYPGFKREADPFRHPLLLAHQIAGRKFEGLEGPPALHQELKRRLFAYSVGTSERIRQLPSFETVRRKAYAVRDQTHKDSLFFAQLERDEEKKERETWQGLAQQFEKDNDALAEEVHRLQAQTASLGSHIKRLREDRGTKSIDPLADFESLPAWVEAHFAGRLYLHPRAIRACKRGLFQDMALVQRALHILANEYWTSRTANADERKEAQERLQRELSAVHLEIGRSISGPRLGEFETQYTVDYRIGQEPRQILDLHLKNAGVSKDERFCLRIYFFWDEVNELLVIGDLPKHLDTRQT